MAHRARAGADGNCAKAVAVLQEGAAAAAGNDSSSMLHLLPRCPRKELLLFVPQQVTLEKVRRAGPCRARARSPSPRHLGGEQQEASYSILQSVSSFLLATSTPPTALPDRVNIMPVRRRAPAAGFCRRSLSSLFSPRARPSGWWRPSAR
jgi:hypothetical protein